MNQKLKPSLWYLIIPIVLLIGTFYAGVRVMSSSFVDLESMETQNLGTEFEIESEAMEQFNVYLELDYDQYVDSISVNNEFVTVLVEDSDNRTEEYQFEVMYLGTDEVYYDVYEPFGSSTIGELSLLFYFEFDTAGSYRITASSDDVSSAEFSINQMNIMGTMSGIFGGVALLLLGGILAIIVTVVIFVLRHMNKKKIANTPAKRPLPENPFE